MLKKLSGKISGKEHDDSAVSQKDIDSWPALRRVLIWAKAVRMTQAKPGGASVVADAMFQIGVSSPLSNNDLHLLELAFDPRHVDHVDAMWKAWLPTKAALDGVSQSLAVKLTVGDLLMVFRAASSVNRVVKSRGVLNTLVALSGSLDMKSMDQALVEFLSESGHEGVEGSTNGKPLIETVIRTALAVSPGYDARLRQVIRRLGESIVGSDVVFVIEDSVLAEIVSQSEDGGDDEEAKKGMKRGAKDLEHTQSKGRGWKIGLGAVAGGLALAVTGGMAAPLVLGLTQAVGLGLSAGTVTMGTVGLLGTIGASQASDGVARVTGGLEYFQYETLKPPGLAVKILIPGWVNEEDHSPFDTMIRAWDKAYPEQKTGAGSGQVVGLMYELKVQRETGRLMGGWKEKTLGQMSQEAFMASLSRLSPGAVLGATKSVVGNPWNVVMNRSHKAGAVLAEDLLKGEVFGSRAVSLIGASIGGRVAFSAALALASSCNCPLKEGGADGERVLVHEPGTPCPLVEGLIEDLVVIGAPVSTRTAEWAAVRRVVSGRLINVYRNGDMVLQTTLRTASTTAAGEASVGAGVSAVSTGGPKSDVENVDDTGVVPSHAYYGDEEALATILRHLGLNHVAPSWPDMMALGGGSRGESGATKE